MKAAKPIIIMAESRWWLGGNLVAELAPDCQPDQGLLCRLTSYISGSVRTVHVDTTSFIRLYQECK